MMDKNLHDDIGDFFNDNIEPLSQPPRKEVWDMLEQQLDKKDAAQYKKKFLFTKRLSTVLILLLLCFATCTYVYFNGQGNDKRNNNTIEGNRNEGNKKDNQANSNVQKQDNNINTEGSGVAVKKGGNEKPAAEGFAKNNTTDKRNKENAVFNALIKKYSNNPKKSVVPLIENTNLYHNPFADTNRHTAASKDKPDIQKKNIFTDADSAANSLSNRIKQLQQPVSVADSLSAITNNTDDTSGMAKIQQQPLPVTLVHDSLSGLANKKVTKKISIQNPLSSRLSLTVFAAPEKVGYHLQNDAINPYDNKELIKNRERADISFSAGILLAYDITNHLTLQSGISFSSANTNIAPSLIYAEKNTAGSIKYRYNTSSGYGYILPSFTDVIAVGDSINATRADQTIQYINIPLLAKYSFDKKRFNFSAGAGISFNFLTKATLNTEVVNAQNQEKEGIAKLAGLKKISYSLLLIPELKYRVSKKFSLSAMPYFKFAPGPVNKGNIVKTYPYNFGLGLGVVYKF